MKSSDSDQVSKRKALAKVSDWDSKRINQSYSKQFQNLFPNLSGPVRTNSKNVSNIARRKVCLQF